MTPLRRRVSTALGALAVLTACTAVSGPPGPACTSVEGGGPMRALLLVPVKIDRQGPFRFVLDTGSTAAVVSNAVAQRLRLRSIGTRGLGAGGSFAARTSVAASMQVAGSTRYAVLLGVTDLGAISHATGMRIDGLLGYTFLQPYEVTIDYPHHRLCLRVPR